MKEPEWWVLGNIEDRKVFFSSEEEGKVGALKIFWWTRKLGVRKKGEGKT